MHIMQLSYKSTTETMFLRYLKDTKRSRIIYTSIYFTWHLTGGLGSSGYGEYGYHI